MQRQHPVSGRKMSNNLNVHLIVLKAVVAVLQLSDHLITVSRNKKLDNFILNRCCVLQTVHLLA